MTTWVLARKGMRGTDKRKELEELGFTVVSEGWGTLEVVPRPDWKVKHYDTFSEIVGPGGTVRIVDHNRPGETGRWLEIRRD